MNDNIPPTMSYAVVHIKDVKIAVPNMSQYTANALSAKINQFIIDVIPLIAQAAKDV